MQVSISYESDHSALPTKERVYEVVKGGMLHVFGGVEYKVESVAEGVAALCEILAAKGVLTPEEVLRIAGIDARNAKFL
jgi:hypothetical protein